MSAIYRLLFSRNLMGCSIASFCLFLILAIASGVTLNPAFMYPAFPLALFFVFDYLYSLMLAWKKVHFKSRLAGLLCVVIFYPFGTWYMRSVPNRLSTARLEQ